MRDITIEWLIEHEYIILDEALHGRAIDQVLEDEELVNYVVGSNYVIQTISQETNDKSTVTYIQRVKTESSSIWVVQLEGCKECPNNFKLDESQPFDIFTRMTR